MSVGIILRLLIVMVLWASCFPLITVGLDLAPHLAFATMRAVLAGLCLLVLAIFLRRQLPQSIRSWTLVGLVGVGATSLGFLGMFHAAEFISPGLATVIANGQPILAAALAHAVLGERLKVAGKLGLMAGLVGIVIIAWPGLATGESHGYTLGIGYVILAAIGVSVGNVAIKRLTGEVDAIMAMGLQLLIGAVPLGLLSILTEDVTSLGFPTDFVVVLVLLAVFGSALAFWLWFTALERVELNRANAFTFFVPIFGLAIGAAIFGEQLGWHQVIGAVLVLTGIVLVQRDAPRRTRIAKPSLTL